MELVRWVAKFGDIQCDLSNSRLRLHNAGIQMLACSVCHRVVALQVSADRNLEVQKQMQHSPNAEQQLLLQLAVSCSVSSTFKMPKWQMSASCESKLGR